MDNPILRELRIQNQQRKICSRATTRDPIPWVSNKFKEDGKIPGYRLTHTSEPHVTITTLVKLMMVAMKPAIHLAALFLRTLQREQTIALARDS